MEVSNIRCVSKTARIDINPSMKKHAALLIVFLVPIAMSCKVAFTENLRIQLESNNIDLKKIQFYNSESIVLQRELTSKETGVVGGKIKIEHGKKIEVIVIGKNTPGICERVGTDTLQILFEKGDNKWIPFVKTDDERKYLLMNREKRERPLRIPNFTRNNLVGTINYDNISYYYGYDHKPILRVKKKQVVDVNKDVRKVKGVKVE
jgi:hypothetical protein